MGLIGWGFLRGEIWQQSGNSPVKAAYLTGTIVMCVGIYMTSSYLLKNEEISFVYRELLKKFKKKGRL
jgi:hypothetical protein